MKKRRSISSEPSKKSWNRSWHHIPCSNCAEPIKVETTTQKVLCGNCVASDPFIAFSTFSGKQFKTFRNVKRYLEITSNIDLRKPKIEPTLTKQSGPDKPQTFASWKARHMDLFIKGKEKK